MTSLNHLNEGAILHNLKQSICESNQEFELSMGVGNETNMQITQAKELYNSLSEGFQSVRNFLTNRTEFHGDFKVKKQLKEHKKSDGDSENESQEEDDEISDEDLELQSSENIRSYAEQLKFIQPSRRIKISDISIRDLQRAYACMDALTSNQLIFCLR